MSNIKVVGARWDRDRSSLKEIRLQVFVQEQGVPVELELDEFDATAEHFIAYADDLAIGCARLIDGKKIGRMAVMPSFRNKGIGKLILDHIKRYATQKRYTLLQLSAQCHAYHFYRSSGFKACSTPYEDAGIPHIDMDLRTFSKDQDQTSQYQINEDPASYHGGSILEAAGYFDIALSQCRTSIVLALNDLGHPLANHNHMLEKIKYLAKRNRQFKTQILLTNYQTSYNEHPIFRLAARLPNCIEIKQSSGSFGNHIIIDETCWFEFDGNASRTCYSDRAKSKLFMERIHASWLNGKSISSARQISI